MLSRVSPFRLYQVIFSVWSKRHISTHFNESQRQSWMILHQSGKSLDQGFFLCRYFILGLDPKVSSSSIQRLWQWGKLVHEQRTMKTHDWWSILMLYSWEMDFACWWLVVLVILLLLLCCCGWLVLKLFCCYCCHWCCCVVLLLCSLPDMCFWSSCWGSECMMMRDDVVLLV